MQTRIADCGLGDGEVTKGDSSPSESRTADARTWSPGPEPGHQGPGPGEWYPAWVTQGSWFRGPGNPSLGINGSVTHRGNRGACDGVGATPSVTVTVRRRSCPDRRGAIVRIAASNEGTPIMAHDGQPMISPRREGQPHPCIDALRSAAQTSLVLVAASQCCTLRQ